MTTNNSILHWLSRRIIRTKLLLVSSGMSNNKCAFAQVCIVGLTPILLWMRILNQRVWLRFPRTNCCSVDRSEVSTTSIISTPFLRGAFPISILPTQGPRKMTRKTAARQLYLVATLDKREEKVGISYLI